MIKVIISGSRFSRERDIIRKAFESFDCDAHVDLYDCNEHVTAMSEDGKQAEINERVRNCDWYILIANTTHYGKYTMMEWETMLDSLASKSHEQLVTVLRCVNPDESAKAQSIVQQGEYQFEDFDKVCKDKGFGEQFYLDYTYDAAFSSLEDVITKEVNNALCKNMILRQHSKPLQCICPQDVYANPYRVNPANGYDDGFYLRRNSVDGELERAGGFIIMTGAPASGKTRAVYEFLRKKGRQEAALDNEVSRFITVNYSNLLVLDDALDKFMRWSQSMPDASSIHLSNYYFVVDQLVDVMCEPTMISTFNRFCSRLVDEFGAKVIATSLVEPYNNLLEDRALLVDVTRIHIPKIEEETDTSFLEALSRMNGDEGDGVSRQVIGDYIPGLRNYNDTVLRALSESDLVPEISAFVKAFNIISIFRKSNTKPLGLVLMVAEKILRRQFDDELLNNRLLEFFAGNNILHIHSIKPGRRSQSVMPDIDRDETFTYDGEYLNMLIPPHYVIHIDNDYVWQFLRSETYALDPACGADMDMAMQAYCKAFFKNVPLATLRRIIARSPSVSMALRYRAGDNSAKAFVFDKIADLHDSSAKFDQTEMNSLIAHLLHRSSTLEELKEDYDAAVDLTKGRFCLSEVVVAEILGFATRKTAKALDDLKAFLIEKGWDFAGRFTSLYYHRRILQFMDSFSDIELYMEEKVLQPEVLGQVADDPDLVAINKKEIIKTVLRKCWHTSHVEKVLVWAEKMEAELDKSFLKVLHQNMAGTPMVKKSVNRKLLTFLCDYFEQKPMAIHPHLVCFYIMKMAVCFDNALMVYKRYEASLESNKSMKFRCITVMLDCTVRYEFAYVYRFFFKDGKLKYQMPQISRNRFLGKLDFNTAMLAYDLLFDSSDADSTPDLYTLISLLSINVEYLKRSRVKDNRENRKADKKNELSDLVYQNLLQILHHPYTRKIGRIDPAVTQILQCCLTKIQEDYVVETYIKPLYIEYDKACTHNRFVEQEYVSRADRFWENILVKPEVALSLIRRQSFVDLQAIHEYVTRTLDKMFGFAQQRLIEPDVLNVYMNKLVSLHTVTPLADILRYRQMLLDYLQTKLPNAENGVSRMDFIIKDEFFYSAYYRLFPEYIVTMINGAYTVDMDVLHDIPQDYVDNKFLSKLVSGVTIFMPEDALRGLLSWIKINRENFKMHVSLYRTIKRKYPDFDAVDMSTMLLPDELQVEDSEPQTGDDDEREDDQGKEGLWDFFNNFVVKYSNPKRYDKEASVRDFEDVLDKLEEVKKQFPDLVPHYHFQHILFKKNLISIGQAIDFLAIVFLSRGLSVSPTLWKSVLETIIANIKKSNDFRIKEQVSKWLDDLIEDYPHMILNDMTTRIYLLNIYVGERKKKYFETIDYKNNFLTVLELSQLLRHHDLFVNNLTDYVSLMQRYHRLNHALRGGYIKTETYGHFLVGCVNIYDDGAPDHIKEFIYDMAQYTEYKEGFAKMLNRLAVPFDSMLNDIEQSLGVSVEHIRSLAD